MLVELAIGDAYGAGFEYASPYFVERYNTPASSTAAWRMAPLATNTWPAWTPNVWAW